MAASASSPGEQCRTAIADAERAQDLPPHLLAAIGRVESGRRDPQSGRWTPWPWTIDVEGQGTFLPNKAAAIEAVQALQARGIQSIDVGCVQINLLYHRDAFASLQQAFDPQLNAAYGARFLRALFRRTQDWRRAVGLYHSATTTLADNYRRKVMAAWPGAVAEAPPVDPVHVLARAWAATLDDPSEASGATVWAAQFVPAPIASPAPHQVLPRALEGSALTAGGRSFAGN